MSRSSCLRIAAVLMFSLLLLSGCTSEAPPPAEENAVTVSMGTAQTMDIARRVVFSGTLRGINEVSVIPETSARVTQVTVKPGDRVSAGQVIVYLDTTNFMAAVQSAQAAYNQALAAKANNDIQLDAAQKTYERTKALYDSGAASQADLEAAERAVNLLSTGAAEASVAMTEAGLKQAQDALDKCAVAAPISGVVGEVNISTGQYASPSVPLLTVSDISQLKTTILVSGSEISYVEKGREVELKVTAVRPEPYTGVITSVAPVANAQTQSFKVEVTLANPGTQVKSGMFAEVSVDTVGKKGIIGVPTDAVIIQSGNPVVYTVTEDMRAHELTVETGIYNHDFIEIISGLEVGQQVIVSGNTLVNEGSKVRVLQEDGGL